MMNKRIQELIEQATESKGFLTAGDSVKPLPVREFNKEKFAELIVRECATTAAMFSMENKRIHPAIDPRDMPSANQMVYHSTCQSVAQEIKQHFGVEE